MIDPTENIRRTLVVEINCHAADRGVLETRYGQVWDTTELANDFEVLGFAAPFVVVKRKADHQLGSLMFQHQPRYYFSLSDASTSNRHRRRSPARRCLLNPLLTCSSRRPGSEAYANLDQDHLTLSVEGERILDATS